MWLAVALFAAGCGTENVAVIEFVDVSPAQPRLGEVTTVRFRVLDFRGQPQAGVPVSFRLASAVPGVTLAPSSTSTLKGSGFAEVQVTVPARVASVIVIAKVGAIEVSSPAISFAGAVPNARQMTFQCGSIAGAASGGVHAIGAFDNARTLIAGVKLSCFAHVGDRNGDGLAGAVVSFLTEAGTIGPSSTSITDVVGNAEVLYKTSYPLPVPTDPERFTWIVDTITPKNTGEYLVPLWMHPWEWNDRPYFNLLANGKGVIIPNLMEPRRPDPIRVCNGVPCINNPRDNLVSMIAVTSGEEAFSDDNNNGVRDGNEAFIDTTEPFVDSNDNGTWDPGERYVDSNGNLRWDGKNNEWDANTLVWVQERILWTGIPDRLDVIGDDPVSAPAVIYVPDGGTAPTGIDVEFMQTFPYPIRFVLSDPWYNSIAQNGGGDGCRLGGEEGDELPVVALPSTFNPGQVLTYPSYRISDFFVRDARDATANADGGSVLARRDPALQFSIPIICRFTGSPISGQVVDVKLGSLTGTVR